jgi:tetratricopeptide (TPR) repeat protein
MNSYESFTPRDAAYFTPLLPLIRAERISALFGPYFRITALYPDQIVLGRCTYLEKLHAGPLDAQSLASRLKRAQIVPLDSDSRVTFSPGNRRKKRANFRVRGAGRATFQIPNHEIEHPLSFLRAHLGERLVVRNRVALNSIGLFLLSLPFIVLMVLSLTWEGDGRYAAIPTGLLGGALLAVFFYDQWTARPPWMRVEKKKKIIKDLSGRQPFRSPRLGLALKCVCGTILLLSFLVGMVSREVAILLWPLSIASVLGLYYGHLLSQRKPDYVRAGDTRPPILYLRSFLDDRKQTLVAYSRWAVAAHVLPPSVMPTPWNYILRFSPVRVIRVLLNQCVDTSEEQIGLFMRRLGPFVAIGQPGDTFAAPGAARMYVTNEEWKGVVDSYLEESKYIVLQPAGTEGVWWEVERVLKKVPLQKILFCMVNFHLHQNDYEAFHLRILPLLGQSVPSLGGLTTTPAFMFIDNAGVPRLVATSYCQPILWPWVGNAVDLPTTLEPFVTPAAAERLPAWPERPRGMTALSHFVANCAYIGALLLVPFLTTAILLIPAVQAARTAANRMKQEKEATPLTVGVNNSSTPITEMIKQADALFDKKDWPALDELTARMIEVDSNDADARAYRALFFQRTAKPTEALQEFEKATELKPKDPLIWGLLGQMQIELKHYADAEAAYSKALELKPEHANYHFNRGFVCFEQKKYEQAAADFAKAIELKSSNQAEACEKCGLALQRSGKVLESLPYFNSAVQLAPDNVDYKLLRARAFEALGNHQFKDGNASEIARAGFEDVLKLVPNSAPARYGRGFALQRLGKQAEAIADFDVVLEKEPTNDVILFRRGFSHLKAGHYKAAFADLQKASELDPKDGNAPELLIRIRMAQGQLDEALTLCNQRLQTTPDQFDLLTRKAIILFVANRPDEGGALLDMIAPQLIENAKVNVAMVGMMLALQSDRKPEMLKQTLAKAEQQSAANPNIPMLGLIAVALRIRLQDYAAADAALHAIDSSKLADLSLAFYQLCEAKIAASLTDEKKVHASAAAACAWFEQHCPPKFEEDQPETLGDDWISRVLLGKFYRDLLPSIPRE